MSIQVQILPRHLMFKSLYHVQCHTRLPESNLGNQLLKEIGRDLRNHHFIDEQETQGDKCGVLMSPGDSRETTANEATVSTVASWLHVRPSVPGYDSTSGSGPQEGLTPAGC